MTQPTLPVAEASMRAVRPQSVAAATLAPRAASASMQAACPLAAAIISGVKPSLDRAFTSACQFVCQTAFSEIACKWARIGNVPETVLKSGYSRYGHCRQQTLERSTHLHLHN